MSAEEQIAEARRARVRRSRTYAKVILLAGLTYMVALWLLPDDSPVYGIVGIAFAAVLILGRLYRDRADEWQRRRHLMAFAVCGAVGICFLVLQAVWASVDSGHNTSAGDALNVIAAAWMLADFALELRAERRQR